MLELAWFPNCVVGVGEACRIGQLLGRVRQVELLGRTHQVELFGRARQVDCCKSSSM